MKSVFYSFLALTFSRTLHAQNIEPIRSGVVNVQPVMDAHSIDQTAKSAKAVCADTPTVVITYSQFDTTETGMTYRLMGHGANRNILYDAEVFYLLVIGRKFLGTPKISYTKKKSAFRQSFGDLRTLLKEGMFSATSVDTATTPYQLFAVTGLKPPGIVEIAVQAREDSVVEKKLNIEIHEKNWALLRIGLQRSQFGKKDFKIESGRIIASPDSARREVWKQNLILLIECHWKRDPELYKPTVFNWTKHNIDRLGVVAGVEVSKDPLDGLFLGVSLDLVTDMAVIAGASWQSVFKNESVAIGNISSLRDAKTYLTREYSKATFFWGLALTPSAMVKALQIKQD